MLVLDIIRDFLALGAALLGCAGMWVLLGRPEHICPVCDTPARGCDCRLDPDPSES